MSNSFFINICTYLKYNKIYIISSNIFLWVYCEYLYNKLSLMNNNLKVPQCLISWVSYSGEKHPVFVLMWMQDSNRCWIPVTLMDFCGDPGADCAAQSRRHAADPGLLWTSCWPATTQPCSAVIQPQPDAYGLGRDVMEKFSAFPTALFPLQADALGGLWFPFVTSQMLNLSRFY